MKRFWLPAAVFAVLLFPSVVHAQNEVDAPAANDTRGLKVSPAIFEVAVKPGESVKKEFMIHNTTTKLLPIQIQPKSIDSIEEPVLYSRVSTYNADDWIKISEPYHILKNQENLKLTATITAPKNAEPCGHYAMISVETMEPYKSNAGTGASIMPRIGIIVFITVPGDCTRKLEFADGRFLPAITANEVIRISPVFKNTGNIHLMQNSKAHISNIFGSRTIDIPPRVVLPNTKKQVDAAWENAPLFGIFKVRIDGSYGPEMTKLTSEDQFILVFRWLPLIIWGVPLLALGYFGWKNKGRLHKAIEAFRKAKEN